MKRSPDLATMSFINRVFIESLKSLSMADFTTSILPYIEHFGTIEKLKTMLSVDPDAIFVAMARPRTYIGCLSGLDLSGGRGHLGTYFVHPDYRNNGIGNLLIDKCFSRLRPLNLTMYCREDLVPYMKKHFEITAVSQWSLLGFRVKVTNKEGEVPTPLMGIKLHSLEEGDEGVEERIVTYDESIRDYPASTLVRSGIREKGVTTRLAMDGNRPCGYGSIRPLRSGEWRLGPLYADNDHVALLLLQVLIRSLPPSGHGSRSFLIYIPQLNPAALRLIKGMGDVQMIYEAKQCSTKELIDVPFSKIFAFRSTRLSSE